MILSSCLTIHRLDFQLSINANGNYMCCRAYTVYVLFFHPHQVPSTTTAEGSLA